MKQFWVIFGLWILFIIVLYMAFSFVAWQFNPQHWTETGRFFYALISIISIAPICGGVTSARLSRNSNEH